MNDFKKYFKIQNGITVNLELIEDVADYLDACKFIHHKWNDVELWYRGVNCSKHKLIPSAYRNTVWDFSTQKGDSLYQEFKRRIHPYVPNAMNLGFFERYQLMQHYGLPTRLLDWTQGYLIALYFAVRESESASIPSVWIIAPGWLNKTTNSDDETIYIVDKDTVDKDTGITSIRRYVTDDKSDLPKYPLAILSPHSDARVASQMSCFTIHGRIKYGLESIASISESSRLAKLRISTSAVRDIKYQLEKMGMRESIIFPDLEGLVREIKSEFGIKW